MSGDNINSLPTNKHISAKPGDLEMVYSIFQPKNAPLIKDAINKGFDSVKLAVYGTILFVIITLPPIVKFIDLYCKGNVVLSKTIQAIIFAVLLFIIQKTTMKNM